MLLELQRAFKATVTGSDDVAAPHVKTPHGSVARRLAVYRNNVQKSLVDVLAAAFPVTQRIVGERFFYALARDFAITHLPQVPQLSLYGSGFAGFIATHRHTQELSYLADVARLEWARSESYFAADMPPLDPQSLTAIAPDKLSEAQLSLHPAARILSSNFPIHRIWSVHQDDAQDIPPVDMTIAESVLITRPHYQVIVRFITAPDAAFVKACSAGASLNDAAFAALSIDEGFDLQAALQRHFECGTFSAVL
jgi:hypothetical protein